MKWARGCVVHRPYLSEQEQVTRPVPLPIIITLGAGLLGLLAGGMLVEDPAIKESMQAAMEDAHMIFEGIGVAIVLLLGTYLKKKQKRKAK